MRVNSPVAVSVRLSIFSLGKKPAKLAKSAKVRIINAKVVNDGAQNAPVSLEEASTPSENSSHDKPDKQAVEHDERNMDMLAQKEMTDRKVRVQR